MLTLAPPKASFASPASLVGRTVLLAEDDSLGDSRLEALLWEAGASVLLAHNAYQAELVAGSHAISSAVLDTELGADTVARICARLRLQAVPFVLVSPSPGLYTGACRPADVLRTLLKLELLCVH